MHFVSGMGRGLVAAQFTALYQLSVYALILEVYNKMAAVTPTSLPFAVGGVV